MQLVTRFPFWVTAVRAVMRTRSARFVKEVRGVIDAERLEVFLIPTASRPRAASRAV
jgi:hypothetical protein